MELPPLGQDPRAEVIIDQSYPSSGQPAGSSRPAAPAPVPTAVKLMYAGSSPSCVSGSGRGGGAAGGQVRSSTRVAAAASGAALSAIRVICQPAMPIAVTTWTVAGTGAIPVVPYDPPGGGRPRVGSRGPPVHGDQGWMRRIWPCPAPKPKPWLET